MTDEKSFRLQELNKSLTKAECLENFKSYFHQEEQILEDKKSIYFENLRYFIAFLQKVKYDAEPEIKVVLKDICGSLLCILTSSAPLRTEAGMLIATAFCSALSIAMHVTDIINLLKCCLHLNHSQVINTNIKDYPSISVHNIEFFQVWLCYGMLCSSRLSSMLLKPESHSSSSFLPVMLSIVEKACMKYSSQTSAAFKVLVRWMYWVVLEAKFQLSESEKEKVFSIVISNWENPISGVKEYNAKAFDLLLEACTEKEDDKYSVTSLMKYTMKECSWRLKTKYYMLNVLLPKYGVKKGCKDFHSIVDGLVSSLYNSYLVPAGSDVYKTCITQLEFQDWRNIFMVVTVNILATRDCEKSTAAQNMIHYWLPGTLKRFPELLEILISQLMEQLCDENNDNLQLSILCLLHFGRKGGQLLINWDTMPEILELVHGALQHSSELIRAEAFAVVCTSSKTTVIPSHIELTAVHSFLMENINADNAVLRYAVLKSWTTLVTHINDSCLHLLKMCANRNEDVKTSNIHTVLQFLNDMHAFLISNLIPGANYQRKILSLKLFELTLQCFQNKCKDHENKMIMYAKEKNCWKFDSEKSLEIILHCVADPTEDIRETAAKILTQYFSFSTPSTVKRSKLLLQQALKLCASPIFYKADSGAVLMKVAGTWISCSEYKPQVIAQTFTVTGNTRAAYNKTLENQRKLLEGLGIMKRRTESTVHVSLQSKPKKFERSLKLVKDLPEKFDNLQHNLPKFEGLVCLDSQDVIHPHCSEPEALTTSRVNLEHHELPHTSPFAHHSSVSVQAPKQKSKKKVLGSKNLSASSDFQQSLIQNNDDISHFIPKQESINTDEACSLCAALITCAEEQFARCKQDLLGALISGSPLCGILCAINKIALCNDGPEYNDATSSDIDRIATLLEDASSYMLHLLESKTQNTEFSPSFAEMDAAIQNIIHQSTQSMSALNSKDEDHTQLSPAHQLILNCIWLNLKACCNLASDTAAHPKCSVMALRRCGQVIIQVLLRCRHKGAIESAGSSLCCFVRNVTRNSKELGILEELLGEFLNMLECGNIKVSVSRRSAGLAILTHRIVSSDMRPGKPFLHLCMMRLLQVAKAPVSSNQDKTDLPQAQAMHSLRMLVQDASLHQDIASYLSQLMLVCFGYFSSSIWSIRNAALQLSGALIPRLVRQNKVHDEDYLGGSTVCIEEFLNHYQDVAEYMLHSLQQANGSKEHSSLVPMLSLLTKLSITSDTFLSPRLRKMVEIFSLCFLQLLKSPIYHVRKLSAKALERFTPLSHVHNLLSTVIFKLQECCNQNMDIAYPQYKENTINGMLFTVKYLIEKLKADIGTLQQSKQQETVKAMLKELQSLDISCYFNKLLLLEILEDQLQDESVNAAREILDLYHTLQAEECSSIPKPGLYLWASKAAENIIKRCPSQHLLLTCHNLCVLFRNYSDVVVSALDTIIWRIIHDRDITTEIHSLLLLTLTNTDFEIISSVHYSVACSYIKLMLVLVEKAQLSIALSLDNIKKFSSHYIFQNSKTLHNAVALPVVVGLLHHAYSMDAFKVNSEFLELMKFLAECVSERSDPKCHIEEFRYYAAKALSLMATMIRKMLITLQEKKYLLKNATEAIIRSFLMLLQDENTEIRKEAAKSSVKYFSHCYSSLSPQACLLKLLEPDFLLTMLPCSDAFAFLCNGLSYTEELCYLSEKYIRLNDIRNEEIVNPFSFGKSNFYAEENKVVDFYGKNLLKLLHLEKPGENSVHFKETIIKYNIKADAETLLSFPDEVHSETASSQDASLFYSVATKLLYLLEAATILGVECSTSDSSYSLLSNALKSKAISFNYSHCVSETGTFQI